MSDYKFRRDGWQVEVRIGGTSSGPGLRGGEPEILEMGDPELVDRAEWDDAFPNDEPTLEAMNAQVEEFMEEILDEAAEDARDNF